MAARVIWSYYRAELEAFRDFSIEDVIASVIPLKAWMTVEEAKAAAEKDWDDACADDDDDTPFEPLKWTAVTGGWTDWSAVVQWDTFPDDKGGTVQVQMDEYVVYCIALEGGE